MKFFLVPIAIALASLNAYSSTIHVIQNTTITSCSALNELLDLEKILVIDRCAKRGTIIVSKKVQQLYKAEKACPSLGAVSYKTFFVQTNDQLKCQVGFECHYAAQGANPPVPLDPPEF